MRNIQFQHSIFNIQFSIVMYDYIRGELVEATPANAVVDCGGVGYYIHISVNT